MAIKEKPNLGLKQIALWCFGSGLLSLTLVCWLMWQKSDRLFTNLKTFFKPQSAELKVAESALLLQKIQNIQKLTTTTYKIDKVVSTSADRILGKNWTIATTKLLYLAKGEVRAGIDLQRLTVDDIVVSSDKIAIAIPQAEILDSKIDVNESQVYHYERGFLNLGPDVAPQLQTFAQQKTLAQITNAACKEGIINQANKQAKSAILELITMTNSKKVEVTIKPESSLSCQ